MKRALILGKVNHDNYGDTLMVMIVASCLIDCGYSVSVVEPGLFLEKQLKQYGLAVNYLDVDSINSAYEVAIYTGGGYFAHNFVNGQKWCKRWLNEGYFIRTAKKLTECKIPYYVFSVEVGPIRNAEMRMAVKNILESAKKVVCRNSESVNFIRTSLCSDVGEVGPDMVFSEIGEFVDRFHDSTIVDPFCKVLGIHITDKFNGSNLIKRLFVRDVLESIRLSNFTKIILFSDNEETVNLDSAFKFIEENLDGNYEIVRFSGVKNVIDKLMETTHVLTTKLHVGVSAMALGKRVICFSDTPKSKRFYRGQGSGSIARGFYLEFYPRRMPVIRNFFNTRESDPLCFSYSNYPSGFYKNEIRALCKKV